MSAWKVIGQGLWLPAELYLRPDRFREQVNAWASTDGKLTVLGAVRAARTDRRAASALSLILLRSVVALTWPCIIALAVALAGMAVNVSGVAIAVALGVAFGGAVGVASGMASGVASGVAFGVASGVAFGVASGLASVIAFGVAVGVASVVALGIASGVADGVASVVASGVAFGLPVGVSFGVDVGIASGVAIGTTVGLTLLHLILIPMEVAAALWSKRLLANGKPVDRIWARHPAQWDPFGLFPLPGLAQLLAELQLRHSVLVSSE